MSHRSPRTLAALALCMVVGSIGPAVAQPHKAVPVPRKAPAPTSGSGLLLDGLGHGLLKFWDISRSHQPAVVSFAFRLADGLYRFNWGMPIEKFTTVDGTGYLEATATRFTALMAVNGPLTSPVFSVHGNYRQDPSTTSVNGQFTVNVPDMAQVPLTSVLVEGRSSMSGYKVAGSRLHVAMDGDLIRLRVVPEFTSADLKFSRKDDLTTLTASLTVPGGSDLSAGFKDLAAAPADIEQKIADGLKGQGLDVQTVKITNARATETEAGADVTIAFTGLNHAVQNLALLMDPHAAAGHGTWQKPIEEMLELQVDDIELHARAHDGQLDGVLTTQVSNLDRFIVGYLDLYDVLLDTMRKMPSRHKSGVMDAYFARAAGLSMGRVRSLWNAIPADSSDRQSYSYQVRYDRTDAAGTLRGSMDGGGDVRSLMQAAAAVQFPMMAAQSMNLDLDADGSAVKGRLDLGVAGPWLEAIKLPYLQAATEFKAMAPVASLLSHLQLIDSKQSVSLHHGQFSGTGYSQFSDLTDLMRVAHRYLPQFKGDLLGGDFSLRNSNGRKTYSHATLYLTGLPTSTPEAVKDVRHAIPDMGPMQVQSVTAAAIALPPLVKPDVALPTSQP